jgi:hypothetical protein
MEGSFNYQCEGLLIELGSLPDTCNRLWGTEYVLLEGKGFMGKTGGAQYEIMIDMLIKIRLERVRRMTEAATPDFQEQGTFSGL